MNNMYKDFAIPFIALVLSLIAFITFHFIFFYFMAASSIVILLSLAILYTELDFIKEKIEHLKKLENE